MEGIESTTNDITCVEFPSAMLKEPSHSILSYFGHVENYL